MAKASIPVDLFNPGQVFACLGFLEAADVLLGDAEGGFDWGDEAAVKFSLAANGDANPFEMVLGFLAKAEVSSLAPAKSKNTTEKWAIPTRVLNDGAPFPFGDPDSPATLPAVLRVGDKEIVIDHWGDATGRNNVKFWAGAGGYPGAALARDALELLRAASYADPSAPFAIRAPQSSSFRLDMRRDYIPMDVGFSPNRHGDLTMVGYPAVEILAAIGLTHARPRRVDRLHYRYGVAMAAGEGLLDKIFLRASLGCANLPFPSRFFAMRLGWPGQEGQARCITDVTEEISP